MMARTVYPDIKMNKQHFSFGECGCNDRRDMILTIKNKNKDLVLDFNFTKVAHFKATPAKGKLFADSEHNITITFAPNSFGDFKEKFNLEILKGIYQIPITLEGICRKEAAKSVGVRGPAAKVEDFHPTLKVLSEEDAAMSTLNETMKRKQPK